MTKRKLRFNPVDFLILIVIAAAAVLFIVFGRGSDIPQGGTEQQVVDIEYVIEIQELDNNFQSTIAAGQAVSDAVERKSIGTVRAVSLSPHTRPGFNFDTNEEVYSPVEGKINLAVTVSAKAVETESAFTVNGYEVRVGKQVSFILPGFQGYGYCIGLKKIG